MFTDIRVQTLMFYLLGFLSALGTSSKADRFIQFDIEGKKQVFLLLSRSVVTGDLCLYFETCFFLFFLRWKISLRHIKLLNEDIMFLWIIERFFFFLAFDQELASCDPLAESSLLPLLVNKVLLEHGYAQSYIWQQKPCDLQSIKYLLFDFLQKNLLTPVKVSSFYLGVYFPGCGGVPGKILHLFAQVHQLLEVPAVLSVPKTSQTGSL